MVKQWEIWTPELRVTNSVSGVGQYFEISKRSHVIIQSNGKAWSRVEVYPTFSIKVGCMFDFSDYPYDQQRCALGIFTAYRMSDVQLSIYYNIQPTVLLGWGAQSDKRHISDWKLEKVSTNLSYYSNGKFSTVRPVDPEQLDISCSELIFFLNEILLHAGWGAQSDKRHISDWKLEKVSTNLSYYSNGKFSTVRPVDPEQLDISWSILYTWLYLKRNAFCFGLAVLLPSVIAYMFVIFSFLLPSPESAIYILIANLFLLGIFLEDLISILPPTIGRAPRIGWGAQSDKRHISDWKLEKVSTNLSYYSNGKFSTVRPVDPEQLDISWSILYTWLYLKRNAFCFGLAVLLPSVIAYMFVIFSFLLPSPESAIYILIANLFLLGIFLEDLISILPPTIGRAPRIAYFTGLNLVLTTFAIGMQFWLRYLLKAPGNAFGWALHIVRIKDMIIPNRWKFEGVKATSNDEEEQFTGLLYFFLNNSFCQLYQFDS
uniref:Neur_chan_LBD domain-containing protein n=1 Tax=Ascaris lumbricoides TaxID=6252 RepID=A0A0M3IR14_ASCLU